MKKQQNPRIEFNSEGLRPESVFALRWMLDAKRIEEGEFLSNLFEKAVRERYNDQGAMLDTLKRTYFEEQEGLDHD